MSNISIGTSGNISYNITNNLCYGGSSGSIIIDNIVFDNLYPQFISYTINWTSSNTINNNQIRDNGRGLADLASGTYSFTINSISSSGSSLGPYNLQLVDPDNFLISDITHSSFSCAENASIAVSVSGGTPPYTFIIGGNVIEQSGTYCSLSGLEANTYTVSVFDLNDCVADTTNVTTSISIEDKSVNFINYGSLPPDVRGGYGYLEVVVVGDGPFSFIFNSSEDVVTTIDNISSSGYQVSFDETINQYVFVFDNLLKPENYTLTISNDYCSTTTDIYIPDLDIISANISISPNISTNQFVSKLLVPIFDTIFIPFKHIQENSSLWQLIQQFISSGKIDIKIDNNVVQYNIIRNFLFPNCNNNEIEIVRLDNNSHNWFFCFHVAPGINLLTNISILNSKLSIIDKKNEAEYRLVFGLEEDRISHDDASLLIGSLIIPGVNTNYYDNKDTNLTVSDVIPISPSDNDFLIKNIKASTYLSLYTLGYTTNIYFLENFNVLTQNININDTACSISNDDFQYILNIKKLLLTINNVNNYQKLYIYDNSITNTGSIYVSISGPTSIRQDDLLVNNSYSVEYFSFNQESTELQSFYQNNQKISGPSLTNLPESHIIIRIKDINNNVVDYVTINGSQTTPYSTYFTQALNILQEYNTNIKSLFNYGDILITISKVSSSVTESESTNITNNTTVNIYNTLPKTIKQSNDLTNTSKIILNTAPPNAVCYLLGPKNYKQQFIGYTIFENVVPGVYNIIGNEDYLLENFLYQNDTRIIVLKNKEYDATISFGSYKNLILKK